MLASPSLYAALLTGQAAAAVVEKHSKAMLELSKAETELTPGMKRNMAAVTAMGKDFERSSDRLHQLELGMKAASATTNHLAKNFSALSVAGGALIASGVQRGMQGLGDSIRFALKSSIDFESSMADVAKVVDGLKTPTGEATAEYHKMEQQMFALSERIAVAPEGFAKIAAAAGQAGIAGSELARFAEDAAKTSVAFGITADDAGTGLAKLRTGLSLSQDEVMSLAGTMNHLSNSMASEAAELLDAVQRVGSIGKAANVSGQEIAALSSAMISAGAGSEMAATGTKNFLLALAAGTSATKHQIEAYELLGLSAETVAQNVTSTDMVTRAEQIKQVIEKIAGLADADRISTMKKLFGSETVGTIGPLATNLELLTKSLKFASDTTAAASSVQTEFESRSKTTANTLQLLKNTLSVTAIAIGSELLPEIGKIATDVAAWVKQNRELIKENVVGFVKNMTGVAKDLYPVLKNVAGVIGTVTSAIGVGNVAYIAMASKVVSLTGGLGELALKTATSLVPALAGMGTKLAALAGPAGLFALGTAAVAGLSFAAMKALIPVGNEMDRIATKAQQMALTVRKAEYDMRQVRLEAMQGQAGALAKQNAEVAKENARKKTIIEAGFSDEGMAESAAAAGMAARRKALHGRRIDQLKAEDKDLVKVSIERAMIAEKLSYMERADRAASGGPGPAANEAPKKGKRGAKKKSTLAEDQRSFDVEMQVYAAKEAKGVRDENIKDQQEAWDKEEALFSKKDAAFDRELAIIDARGMAEEEAQTAREALLDRRLGAELKFAKEQAKLARTDAQREQATTRMESVEHQKRLVALKKQTAAEAAENARKVALAEMITGRITDLGTAMVDASWAAAEGQKGAGLKALGDYLKTVSKQMGIKALVETALGVSALAGIVTAPLAAPHFAAAGIAAGVAIAAGGAGIGLSAAGDAVATPPSTGRPEAAATDAGGVSKSDATSGGGGGGGGEKREMKAQETPISYFDPSRAPVGATSHTTVNNNIDLSGGFWSSSGPEKAAQQIEKILRQGGSAGKR